MEMKKWTDMKQPSAHFWKQEIYQCKSWLFPHEVPRTPVKERCSNPVIKKLHMMSRSVDSGTEGKRAES